MCCTNYGTIIVFNEHKKFSLIHSFVLKNRQLPNNAENLKVEIFRQSKAFCNYGGKVPFSKIQFSIFFVKSNRISVLWIRFFLSRSFALEGLKLKHCMCLSGFFSQKINLFPFSSNHNDSIDVFSARYKLVYINYGKIIITIHSCCSLSRDSHWVSQKQ